jgi:hypothetical protein
MSRRILFVAITLVAYYGCSDSPTGPSRQTARLAADDDASLLVVPEGASSICVASVKDLAGLTSQLSASPGDSTLIAARSAQSEITADVCR